MKSQQFQLIKNEIKRSVSAKNLTSIILFGSAVTAPQSAQDYDVRIVTKKLPLQDWILAGTIKYRLLGKLDKPLDVVFMEEQDLNYASPFIYEINHKSRLLYGKDLRSKLRKASQNVETFTERGAPIGWQIATSGGLSADVGGNT